MIGYESRRNSNWPTPSQRSADRRTALPELDCTATLSEVVHHDLLLAAFRDLRRNGGTSPGPDGLTYADLSNSQAAAFSRLLSTEIIDGDYWPEPARLVQIPKSGGRGTRTLQLSNLRDRIVAKTLNEALSPIWEQIFLPCSFGFRRGQSAIDLLAALEQEIPAGRHVLAIDDIRDAFGHVSQPIALACHEQIFDNEPLLRLIEKVLASEPLPGLDGGIGIAQGCCYSPTALNALLHYNLDVPLANEPSGPPFFRYADNLVFAATSVSEGRQAIQKARRLLKPLKMSLKGEDGVIDLAAGGQAQLLGFTVRKRGEKLSLSLGKDALAELHANLSNAHGQREPQRTAKGSLFGWLAAHGVGLKASGLSVESLLRIAAEHGFREVGTVDELERCRKSACRRWSKARKRARANREAIEAG